MSLSDFPVDFTVGWCDPDRTCTKSRIDSFVSPAVAASVLAKVKKG